jgi:hypothetical protein
MRILADTFARSAVVAFALNALLFASPAAAQSVVGAQPSGCQRQSVFGTVATPVVNDRFNFATLRTDFGHIDVDTRGAVIHANGLTIRPGIFAGVFGCFAPGNRIFKAEEITLSTSPMSYNGYGRKSVTIQGTVTQIEHGRLGVEAPHYGHLYVYTSRTGYRIGERVSITGNFNPQDSSFNAATITPVP